MISLRVSFSSACLALALLFTGGCDYQLSGCEGAECEEHIGSVSQEAFVVGSFSPWALSNGQLRLCFKRDASLTTAEFGKLRDRVVLVLNDTWGRVPGLDFVSGCADPSMQITLLLGSGYGNCGLGNGASCNVWGDPVDVTTVDGTAIHEVGHGLGMVHEHQRPDAAPLCEFEQGILDGCTKCSAATCTAAEATLCWFRAPASSKITVSSADKSAAAALYAAGAAECKPCSTGTCTVGDCVTDDAGVTTCTPSASYYGCFHANPSTGTITLSTGDRDSAKGRVGDRTADVNGKVLTKYDPLSVMNYCSGFAGRRDSIPTAYDMLGMEMLYSNNRTYGMGCKSGCFVTASGLVTSTSGSIVSEWIARGSQGVPFRVSGAASDVYSYPVTSLADGGSSVSYTFKDPVGNSRSGASQVEKSNARFAALASAVAMIP